MNETEINDAVKRITQDCESLLKGMGMSTTPSLNDYKNYFQTLARSFESEPKEVGSNLVMALIMSLYGLCHLGGIPFTDLLRSMDRPPAGGGTDAG